MLDVTGPAANTRSAKRARDAPSLSFSRPSPHDPTASSPATVVPRPRLSFHQQLQEDAVQRLHKLLDELDKLDGLLEGVRATQRVLLAEMREQVKNELDEASRTTRQLRQETTAFSADVARMTAEMSDIAEDLLTLTGRLLQLVGTVIRPNQWIVRQDGAEPRLALFLPARQLASLPTTLANIKENGFLAGLLDGHEFSQDDLDAAKDEFPILADEAADMDDLSRQMADRWRHIVSEQAAILDDEIAASKAISTSELDLEELERAVEEVHVALREFEPKAEDEIRIERGAYVCVLETKSDGWSLGYSLTGDERAQVGFFPHEHVMRRSSAENPVPARVDSLVALPKKELPRCADESLVDCTKQHFEFRRLVNSIRLNCGCCILRTQNSIWKRSGELNASAARLRQQTDHTALAQERINAKLGGLVDKVVELELRRSKVVERMDDQIISLVILSRRPD